MDTASAAQQRNHGRPINEGITQVFRRHAPNEKKENFIIW